MINKSLIILSSLFYASVLSYKVLVFNDLHADPTYDAVSCVPPPDDSADPVTVQPTLL